MKSSIISIISELKTEQAAGDEMAEQLVERIDAHIRDLAVLKAWILDSARTRSMAIGAMLGSEPEAPATPAAEPAPPQDEAA